MHRLTMHRLTVFCAVAAAVVGIGLQTATATAGTGAGPAPAAPAALAAPAPPRAARPAQPVAPGTATRTVLTPDEAARFTPAGYLSRSGTLDAPSTDPWTPAPVRFPRRADLVVSPTGMPGTYRSVQAAVDTAVRAGGSRRRTVAVLPGRYTGAVFVPASAPPLTIYGAAADPRQVRLELAVTATMTPAEYTAAVQAAGAVPTESGAAAMFASCTGTTAATVGSCAAVLWSAAEDVQLARLTVTNTTPDLPGTVQALAVRAEGDRTQLDSMHLVSRQDTLLLTTASRTTIARASVRDSYVEGDVDFVFGRATAVFERTRFHSVTTRRPEGSGFVFAPSTEPGQPYGFLVVRSRFTADAGYVAAPTAYLGRSWDTGARVTGYLPGLTPNGQLVVRESLIGPGYRTADPWGPAATTTRPFTGNVAAGRDLDDPAFNRLWEYRNRVVTR